jgi:haloacetate dehalogenase
VLWGDEGFVGRAYEVLEVWNRYASDVRGHAIGCGHFLAEEEPEATYTALRAFLTS